MVKNEDSKFFIRDGILFKSCPACSTGVGKSVFYPCPESFGYRYNYSQSLCVKCRGKKGNPTVPYAGYTFQNDNDILIPAIRILPMGKGEFATYDDCVEFLTKTMPNRGNTFFYKTRNLVTEFNSLVMFQYDGEIVAYGFYENDTPIDESHPQFLGDRKGYYKFINGSIKILENPITNNQMQEIFDITLAQGTTKVKLSFLPKFLELFEENEEITPEDIGDIKEKKFHEVRNFEITGIHTFKEKNAKNYTKDYEKAQKNQTAVGKLGEELVCEHEKEKLINKGLTHLANKVEIVSSNTSLGYDVLSFDESGNEIHIEVKSKSGKLNYLDFYITDNEYEKLKNNSNHVIYYISHLKSITPLLFVLKGSMINDSNVRPVLYRVSLEYEIKE